MTGSRIKKVGMGLIMAVLLGMTGMGRGQEISPQGNPWLWVSIGTVKIKAEAVSTPERLYRGLSYRQKLPEGQGMLFFLPAIETQAFCMRGMRFPLDFVWIVGGRVAGITRNVPPTFTGNLPSPQPVNYVLEVPGGFAGKYGLRVGDRVSW
jgi:uncharacterized membrane protein (UPF0127 family)